jgi:hypothetical protein
VHLEDGREILLTRIQHASHLWRIPLRNAQRS